MRGRAIASEDDCRNIWGATGGIDTAVQFVNRVGAEGVADGRAVEGNAYHRKILPSRGVVRRAPRHEAVEGHVGQRIPGKVNIAPAGCIKNVRNERKSAHPVEATTAGLPGMTS